MSRACAGLPFSHTRPLEPNERGWLAERARIARKRRLWLGLGTSLVPVLLCVPLALALAENAAGLLMIPAVWFCLTLPLKWLDARKRARLAIVSARAEAADVYEGVPGVGALGEAGLGALLQAGYVLDEDTVQRLDRVATSGEAIRLNHQRLDPPIVTDETDVALPQRPAEEFPAIVPRFAMAAPGYERRPLSPAELAELRQLAPARESLRQHGCLMGFCLYLFAGTFQRIEGQPAASFFLVALRVATIGYLSWRAFLAARERTRIRRDIREGVVARVESDGALLEVLPHLGMVWTVDGTPSPWRHAAQAKPRPPQ